MRITNKMLSNNFLRDMRTNLNNLSKIQTQMATGKQINKPSDDPAKASKIMQMYSEIDANKQYNDNITNTSNWLDMTDSTLGQVGSVATRIQELLVSAGKAGYGPDEKAAIKDEINQRVGELSQMINTTFDGKYIFGGTNGASKPVGTIDVDGDTELISNVKSQVVASLTAGKMTAKNSLKSNQGAVTLGTDTLKIDGQPIKVDWDALTDTQKSQIQTDLSGASDSTLNSVKDTIVNTINLAIDKSGTGVSHISGSFEAGKIVLKSGSGGTNSEVQLTAFTANTSIGAKILSDNDGAISSSVENTGTSKYNGNNVASGSIFNMSLNGVPMVVTTTTAITKGDTMESAASSLNSDIKTAIGKANVDIEAANKVAGRAIGTGAIKPANVTVSDDGRFVIDSPSGTITFSDTTGKTTTKDLGLSGGPKDTLLVEISQGVTMDYNITASQVINYGDGDNNLINLLANITKHLGSDDAKDISALNNADLKGIQDFATNVLKLRSEVGAKQNSMDSALARNSDQNTNMTEILSKTEDIDITEKAMEYATMQTIYMAALQTSAKVIQPSLLDYLR
ncbi:flagellar hook-associated protein FlgL [Clostridium estertheticum]|uniref:flagellar hook-associated protein FlgL n=1 Tax=Clostridium estertheticum TaxID=238834 RepID=UPI001C6F095D|nr:flagellar hook-associated protein FlgL [Clostridium estertheticum]MBW9170630.1 flagellar hook-associated protein FlgL [Clostridium estertheticum]WLC74522.1 flagellar hook-associated protein FlgL [Clostridium estertheticum]